MQLKKYYVQVALLPRLGFMRLTSKLMQAETKKRLQNIVKRRQRWFKIISTLMKIQRNKDIKEENHYRLLQYPVKLHN